MRLKIQFKNCYQANQKSCGKILGFFQQHQEVKYYQKKQTSYEHESHYTSVMIANKPDRKSGLVEQKMLSAAAAGSVEMSFYQLN